MLNTISKRIQTRLSKQGVKVSLGDIRPVVEQMINDIDNPTDQEVLSVVDHFMNNATSLIVITTDVDTVDSVDTTINTESIQDIDSQEETAIAPNTPEELAEFYKHPALFTPNQDDQPAPLATTNKSELVANTAVNLGIELSTADIENIADNFDAGSDDFTQTLEQVKGAIIAYVQHKIASNNQKIVNTINEISQVATDGFNQNSETLTNGLKQLNQQLIQQSTDFKSKLAGTLSRFKLPEAS